MGGSPDYDRDVYGSSSYTNWGASTYSATKLNNSILDSSMRPNGKIIKSKSKNPIIIVLDVTGSNINFARLVYDKLPMFYVEIKQKGYLKDFDISICALGDAYCDNYPIQIGKFAKGIEIDAEIEKLVLEAGGGGQKTESYELMAHYLVNNVQFEKNSHPMIFFIGDEKPYSHVDPKQAEEIGIPCEEYDPFPLLNEKYENRVYMMLNKYCGNMFINDVTSTWTEKLPAQHVIKLPEEKAIVDLLLGTIALEGRNDLEIYALDMRNRGQTQARIEGVTDALKNLSNSMALQRIEDINVDLQSQIKLIRKPNSGRRI